MKKLGIFLWMVLMLVVMPVQVFAMEMNDGGEFNLGDSFLDDAGSSSVSMNDAGNTMEELSSEDSLDINEGTIITNNGTLVENTSTGEVTYNNGVIENNNGVITYNYGTIKNNSGTVIHNYGIIEGNSGTVQDDFGNIDNNLGGTITNHYYKLEVNGNVTVYGFVDDMEEAALTIDESGNIWTLSHELKLIITPLQGYAITSEESVKFEFVSGDGAVFINEEGIYEILNLDSDIVLTVETEPYVEYNVIEGANQTWTGTGDLVVKSDGEFTRFKGLLCAAKDDNKIAILENGIEYTVVSGSTVVTLKNSYLSTLTPGEYTLIFDYNNGSATTYFTVAEEPEIVEPENVSPKTGENLFGSLYVFLIMIGFMVVVPHLKLEKNR